MNANTSQIDSLTSGKVRDIAYLNKNKLFSRPVTKDEIPNVYINKEIELIIKNTYITVF